MLNKPVSQSCAVGKSEIFWRATGQSNFADSMEDCSTGESVVVWVRIPNIRSFCCSQPFVHQVLLCCGLPEVLSFSYCAWLWNWFIDPWDTIWEIHEGRLGLWASFLPWLCVPGADWLGRQSRIMWSPFSFNKLGNLSNYVDLLQFKEDITTSNRKHREEVKRLERAVAEEKVKSGFVWCFERSNVSQSN